MALSLASDIEEQLATDRFGRALHAFEEVDSTNTEAAEWATEGAPEGAVVLTEYQRTGRGRHGRTWSADKGQNLLFSVVLRPELDPDRLGLITVAAAVAVAETVENFVHPHQAAIEWPNDVLLEDRKTCGILLESSISTPDADTVVVLGIGLNVNQTEFPEALTGTATSLRLTAGRAIPRPPVLRRLLRALESRYDAIQRDGADAVRAAFHDRLTSLGDSITLRFTGTDRSVTGVVQGISEDGALCLRTEAGERTMHAGEVTTQ